MLIRKKSQRLKVLMTAAEVSPLAKVGGLADVTGSLPPALKKLGVDIRIIMPKYGSIDEKKYKLKKVRENIVVPTAGKEQMINIWETTSAVKGVKVYLIENKKYFGHPSVYHGKNTEKFLFFSLCALQSLSVLKFRPDVIHCHDFHASMIIDLLKSANYFSGYLSDVKTLYTIHNLNYQGKSEIEVLSTGNLNKDMLSALSKDAQDGDINFMVQGIVNADAVNTVSKTYAKEITTSVYGAGLERVLRDNKSKLKGIVNGIDVDFFNPTNDRNIKYKYSVKDLSKKADNKKYLQKIAGLPQDESKAVMGMVSRLAWQKGLELFTEKLIKESDCQFVFLGTGQKEYEDSLKKLAKKFPDKVSANIMFDIKFAQQIYAGSDIFLMPSRFEPCGLGQMIAMRYGTVPVVRATGGLADTVDSKVGFKFNEFEASAFEKSVNTALNVYYKKPKKWKTIVKNCMKRDFSWNKSAKEYLKMYWQIVKS